MQPKIKFFYIFMFKERGRILEIEADYGKAWIWNLVMSRDNVIWNVGTFEIQCL